MRVRTRGAIVDQDLAYFQLRMQQGRLGHVVGPHRCGQDLQEKARTDVEKRQHIRHGKAPADALAVRLTEFLLKFRRVGHAKGRTVDVENTVAAPALGVLQGGAQDDTDALQQGLQHRQRETASLFNKRPR